MLLKNLRKYTFKYRNLRGNTQWPLEDVFIIDPRTVVHKKQQVHKPAVPLKVRTDPVIIALLIAQKNHSNPRDRAHLHQTLDVLQPLDGKQDFLLLTAIQNQHHTVCVERNVPLDHCWPRVETEDRLR